VRIILNTIDMVPPDGRRKPMPLSASSGPGAWIDDFVNSSDPRFKGKSKQKRIQQALAAYYSKKRGESMSSPVLKILNLIELDDDPDRRSVVSGSPPSGLKQPVGSGQTLSSGNASLSTPVSNSPVSPTPNVLNRPTLSNAVSTPELTTTPQPSSLTTSASDLLGSGAQMSPPDTMPATPGGSPGSMGQSPRELSNALAKNGSKSEAT